MGILAPSVLIFFTCLLIWRACDGFEIASEYLGRNLSEGVRGGTINAVSSSLPELLTTLIALFVLDDRDGFSVGIGTTAGSALFNGMIIPAACIFAVVGSVVAGVRVSSVSVSTKVLLRDGISLILCEIVLIVVISGDALHWWQGLILMGLYVTYLSYMLLSMPSTDGGERATDEDGDDGPSGQEGRSLLGTVFYWLSGGPALELERYFIGEKQNGQIDRKTWNAWPLLLCCSTVIGVACFGLVKACEWLGTGPGNDLHPSYQLFGHTLHGFGIPTMFVAVIFASMATSVPDTVISVRDATDGDYDDAVANALGSNIFDICFALGFPLFIYTLLNGPIKLSPETASQSAELLFLLLCLTVVGFVIYVFGQRRNSTSGVSFVEMKRGKAVLLVLLYVVFAVYILGLSLETEWSTSLSMSIQKILALLPKIG